MQTKLDICRAVEVTTLLYGNETWTIYDQHADIKLCIVSTLWASGSSSAWCDDTMGEVIDHWITYLQLQNVFCITNKIKKEQSNMWRKNRTTTAISCQMASPQLYSTPDFLFNNMYMYGTACSWSPQIWSANTHSVNLICRTTVSKQLVMCCFNGKHLAFIKLTANNAYAYTTILSAR